MSYLILSNVTNGQTASIPERQEKVEKIENATVRILVNGKPNGADSVISKDGLIATAFHVLFIEYISCEDVQIIASPIEVEFIH